MDLLLATLRSLRAHGLRFGLTSLGVVWGAFMLTFLSGMMAGVEKHFVKELEEVGPKIVYLGPGSILKNRVGERGARTVELEREDVERIASLHSVEDTSPYLQIWSQIVRVGGRTKLLHLEGVTESSLAIRNFEVAEGRFITPLDVERGARVAFVGARAAERLFGRELRVDREIEINGVRFRVIGVSVAKGDQLINTGRPDDLLILVPYTTAQRWFTQSDLITEVMFSPRDREIGYQSVRQVREILGLHQGFSPDLDTALWSFNLYDVLKTIYAMMFALRFFLVAAGVVTLLVGAVGVMNIMLVVVGERVNEIGLRKAVGAPAGAIFRQFLAEAGAVCGLSGLFGAGLGVAVTQLLARAMGPDNPLASPPILDPLTVVAIVAGLACVGIIAGVFPAIRAARIPPAEALRAV